MIIQVGPIQNLVPSQAENFLWLAGSREPFFFFFFACMRKMPKTRQDLKCTGDLAQRSGHCVQGLERGLEAPRTQSPFLPVQGPGSGQPPEEAWNPIPPEYLIRAWLVTILTLDSCETQNPPAFQTYRHRQRKRRCGLKWLLLW